MTDSDHESLSDPHSDHESVYDVEPTSLFTVIHHNVPIQIPLYTDHATIQDLSDAVVNDLEIPAAHQKFLITPKTGLLKPPFKDPSLSLSSLEGKKVVLLGATNAQIASLANDLAAREARQQRRREALQAGRRVKPNTHVDSRRAQEEAKYTFSSIRPLTHLPQSDKSLRFLQRLAQDAGIKASMRKHHFQVGLLTEMDPAEHTTHESRTLGLNRNRGEVIELRLRTDAYDGYRDYKVIRKTLCHELAHNVWGDHDANFWKLCREIEDEVAKNDWRRGGHSVGGQEFYEPNDPGVEDEEADHGGWTGGEYVLGGGSTATSAGIEERGLSRREIMAKAAEERIKRMNAARSAERSAKEGPS